MGKVKDITGQKFGKLTVIKRHGNDNFGQATWGCLCECGKKKVVTGYDLRGGRSKSCGCLQRSGTHGKSKTRLYRTWVSMKTRCLDENHNSYASYGGRGIKVCEYWLNPKNFMDWALKNGYDMALQLDRIDNNGNYCPENCRYVTSKKNNQNRSNNVTYMGECASEASRRLGGKRNLVSSRIQYGMSIEKAFTTPLMRKQVSKCS